MTAYKLLVGNQLTGHTKIYEGYSILELCREYAKIRESGHPTHVEIWTRRTYKSRWQLEDGGAERYGVQPTSSTTNKEAEQSNKSC
jgi:hypothetical protein